MDESSKDAVIRQQQLIIADQTTTINTQRNRIAELEYVRHQHDLIYTQPIGFLLWFWRSRIWPFSLLWSHERVD